MSCTEESCASTCVVMSHRSTKSQMRVSRAVYCDLKQLGICYATLTQRGTTGGQCHLRAPEPIPLIVSKPMISVVKQTGVLFFSCCPCRQGRGWPWLLPCFLRIFFHLLTFLSLHSLTLTPIFCGFWVCVNNTNLVILTSTESRNEYTTAGSRSGRSLTS